jgi:3-dehydroquinate synthase
VGAGARADLPALLGRHAPSARYAVVSDATVAPLYGEPLVAALAATGCAARLFTFPAGERHKSRATWEALSDAMLADRLGRDATVVAVGGGVTGDLAGFVAATFMRGIPHVQVPTSTVAMLDAAVGGKTGVDTPAGKNLVGAFHQPRLVVADTETLRTLPAAPFTEGLAEAVKHGVIADAAYLAELEAGASAILARDPAVLERVVARSVAIKAAVVADDPTETGRRAVLNFGHTVAHAIEAAAGFAVPHGVAVAVGMVTEARLGERLGCTARGTAARIGAAVERLGLPRTVPVGLATEQLIACMGGDKKVRAGTLRFALPAAIGQMVPGDAGGWSLPADLTAVRAALHEAGAAGE